MICFFALKHSKSVDGKVPTIERLRNYFPIFMKKKYLGGAFLLVNVARTSKKDLEEQFTEFIKERKQDHTMKKLERNAKRNYEVSSNTMIWKSNLRSDELKRYLEIFDLRREGFSMKQIIEMSEKDSTDTNIVSKFHQDLKRARKIIKNVEAGSFPGNYQPNS